MSDTKKNWLDKTGVIHLWKTIKALLDTKVDKIEGLGLSSNDYTVEDKTKVSKIKPVQNTLTSTDTEAGLSAAQGKVLKDIVDTKADNINVQPITIPTTGWGTENGVSAYPNYIDIPLAGVSSKDAVVIDISPSSAYFAAQAQFTNTESMDGAVRIRAKNVPTAAIKGQWYVIHGGGTVYEGELHNYYDKTAVDKLLAGKLDLTGGTMKNTLLFDIDTDLNPFYANKNVDGDFAIRLHRSKTEADVAFGILGSNIGIWDFVQKQWIINSVLGNKNIYIGGQQCFGFVVASGSTYVRFGDGTQICWGVVQLNGAISDSNLRVTFPLPFFDTPRIFSANNANVGVGINVGIGWENSTSFTIGTSGAASNGYTSWFAIGRWK